MTTIDSLSRICILITFVATVCSGCSESESEGRTVGEATSARSAQPACDDDNGGIELAGDFCAFVVADNIGRARHLTVRENGDVYVALRTPSEDGAIAALRDGDGDGRADDVEYFGDTGGTGIGLHDEFLYFAANTFIVRYPLKEDELLPVGSPETVVADFPDQRGHATKPFAIDGSGNMYVNVGAPSNACQDPPRTAGVSGQDPCPLLAQHAGVWRFKSDVPAQTYENDGTRYATGIRNAVAISWNPFTEKLYVVQHGRDQLGAFWPEFFSDSLNAQLPAEEFFEVDEGDDFGWPYCYYDPLQQEKVVAPEYGGDGKNVGRCCCAEHPIVAFPGHWAPNDLVFYAGDQFPNRYREGAFVAFHGSWNRAPLPQQGYKVVFVPFEGGKPSGGYEVFADGFAGEGPIASSGDARYRPMGLALGPDGSLYISDSVVGRIWRVLYTGN